MSGYDDDEYDEVEPTVECPSCGCEMLEISFHCPRCGEYSSKENPQQIDQPRWVMMTAILCLGVILYLWLF